MNVTDDFAALMTQLHEPAPPPSLTATVMARIARDADLQRVTAVGENAAERRYDRPVWLWMVAGLAVVLCVSVYGWLQAGSMPDFTSPRIGGSANVIPVPGPAALLMGLGLLIYMAGLFAPLRPSRRR